ncbi:helicase with zinc finger domain 2-like isoform X1 [Acipenser ruthenus]|uniref:helicase with zinc finger domain 2-like isoform X1 n=1 Tax=Acipenser ruthenus TaxID=7906 RepID=UPI0027411513|nr:helicase with zinc finger domain 2-like isoform X1 [Acipenser ruthenus]XP_058847097.1 helicase with zinc finger domain 2-like isoform X1 [Acipenser ruthenus]
MTAPQTNGSVLSELLRTHDLCIACSLCSQKENDITYSVKKVNHHCKHEVLLVRQKGNGSKWKHLSRRPQFPNPSRYFKCWFYTVGTGCAKHQNRCTFARCEEEATVWTFQKIHNLQYNALMKLLMEKQPPTGPKASSKQLSSSEKILIEFAGEFQELCNPCFYSSPQQIAAKALHRNPTCTSTMKHTWKPLLVHANTEGSNKKVYNEIRPPPPLTNLAYCRYVTKGVPCWHGSSRCCYAHSEVEMSVWKAEVEGELNRSDLLMHSRKKETPVPPAPQVQLYCKACLLTFSSQESFINHCFSLEHAGMISEDTAMEWKYRAPPQRRIQEMLLCDRPDTCEYGENCVCAHSVEEMQEWIMRAREAHKKRKAVEQYGLLSYQDRLLEEYRTCCSEVLIMSQQIEGVSITCDKELMVQCEERQAQLKWSFKVQSERLLVHVALLKQEPGATFTLTQDGSPKVRSYAEGKRFSTSDRTFLIEIFFESVNSGIYEQWVVFDFDMRPVVVQKIKVRVGQQNFVQPDMCLEGKESGFADLERWNSGNRIIVPCFEKREAEQQLLKKYKAPVLTLQYKQRTGEKTPITQMNYKEQMHSFLNREEQAEEEVLSKLSQKVTISTTDMLDGPLSGMKIAPPGDLFAKVPVAYALTPDTNEGYLLKKAVQLALLAPNPQVNNKVYETTILRDANDEKNIYLQLSKRCCSDLDFQKDKEYDVEVQFQMDRLRSFCTWHLAVDLLPEVKIVLPDFAACSVPVSGGTFPKGNAKQQTAISFIVGDRTGPVAPLLIYGPFGTGKTFTLANAAMETVRQPVTRVLICTHTNSAADLYVKEHLHHYVSAGHPEAVPLRIKSETLPLNSTDAITLQYCHLSEDGRSFTFPDRATLDSHRIIITTTMMAKHFHDLKLPRGYFTHILIDEASQMLECAAIMPLSLATSTTRVVLAGDHMQMTPKLFSVGGSQCSDYTLLNRLFHFYQKEKHEVAKKSRIIFNENYRSTKGIIDFVSTHFYIKGDTIKASGNVPPHPRFHSLMFYDVHGTCTPDPSTMSWFNIEEINQVAETVQGLLKDWPTEWGNPEQRTICVVSDGAQVILIRKELRNRNLGKVTVENLANIQGKQFRVIVITTVQTRESLLTSNSDNLEFFNEAQVLNTAMTRAQSQVIVVGDAAGLCCFGNCSKIWKSYIKQCVNEGTAYPEYLTMDSIDRAVVEFTKFIKTEGEDDSDTESFTSEFNDNVDDPILQELLDETKNMTVTVTDEGLLDIFHNSENERSSQEQDFYQEHDSPKQREDLYTDFPEPTLNLYLQMQPNIYKLCELVMEKFDSGYGRPFNEPMMQIRIKGRKNIGMSFPGDHVVVQIFTSPENESAAPSGKVVGVLKKADSPRVFVCTIDSYDRQVMTPMNNCVTKIYTPCCKNNRNSLPIRKFVKNRWDIVRFEKMNEESKRKNLYVVQVLEWRKQFYYPLGVVTEVLPIGMSLEEGLKTLNLEYQLSTNRSQQVFDELEKSNELQLNGEKRKDFRKYPTFTIDPKNSKDLDDAVSVRDLDDMYEIGIHIADVASFVAKDSALDKDAKKRGVTYYAPDREPFHMLPKELSTDLLSLLPNKDRRTISLLVLVEKGTDRVVKGTFTVCLINSDRAFSYEEAEDIIRTQQNEFRFDSLESCLAVAYHFSQIHRKHRLLGDLHYEQPDEDISPGKRKSHQMVQELMIMFNSFVALYLVKKDISKDCTPLRCQSCPDRQLVSQLKSKYRSLIPLSVHLTYRMGRCQSGNDFEDSFQQQEQSATNNTFSILTSVWKDLASAAEDRDISKMIDLISTDDFHPQLLPVVSEFRRLLGKSYTIRSNSSPQSNVGHYSLQLESYTWASSPIRRYLDIIVQRQLHAALYQTTVQYSIQEMDLLCMEFTQKSGKGSAYEKKAHMLSLASKLKKQGMQKLAFVLIVQPKGDGFRVSFPFNKHTLPDSHFINYRHLQLVDQPLFDEEMKCMILKWRRRVYSMETSKTNIELRGPQCNPYTTPVQIDTWQQIVAALRKEDWDRVTEIFSNMFPVESSSDQTAKLVMDRKPIQKNVSQTVESSSTQKKAWKSTDGRSGNFFKGKTNFDHYVNLTLNLKAGDTLQVQMTTDINRGLLVPAVQLLNIHPKFEVCLDHAKNPVVCFSKYAVRASKKRYTNVQEYQKIWKPLCEMESASSAVAENDSIIIEDMSLTWIKEKGGKQNGTFYLPVEYKKEWSIECDLSKCFLCIRCRGMKQSWKTEDLKGAPYCSEHVDPNNFTWVAHGITTNKLDQSEMKNPPPIKVQFYINHMSMENTPVCVFQADTQFTVELIPKLLPDARKEDAIASLIGANELVKNIAVGHTVPPQASRSAISKLRTFIIQGLGLPQMNESQNNAIRQALKNSFTLIQGPPGTGKTVVGVHIVYWFHKMNLEANNSKKTRKTNEAEETKKTCILYCGPSNKSVDVVAEYLLKFTETLRPLRVYSEQMEMIEFPYPGSILQLSRKSTREGKPKAELRSITLHHKIRTSQNPFSTLILNFDARIRREEDLTDEEVEQYKHALIKARRYELAKHDVILCTCTAAASPSLKLNVNPREILIDECAMATEPEALIPLVSYKPEKIVLIGDHKQLRPVVQNELLRKLGMEKSLFERYMDQAVMLDTQYRMHEEICAFPSMEFYKGRLKTDVIRPTSVLHAEWKRCTPILFGHVVGEEVSLVVSSEKGNENSKANLEEAEMAVRVAKLLINVSKVRPETIAILTPYNAQVSEIQKLLLKSEIQNVAVSTIMKSQGSEWRYVILSTVRSLLCSKIETEPTKSWIMKNLGFVTDPNQVNVGITRAQEGLCIIGNRNLLHCSPLWKKLLKHFTAKNCVVNAKDITVQKPRAR